MTPNTQEMEVYSPDTVLEQLPLSNLSELSTHVERLLVELSPADAADELAIALAKAEAATLWAQRTKNVEQERRFGKARLLIEAGLGVIALNGFEVAGKRAQVAQWRVLAVAFERGRLLECSEASTKLADVAAEVRRRGLTFVPGDSLPLRTIRSRRGSWRWYEARKICHQHGIDPKTLPPDVKRITAESERRSKAATRRAEEARRYRANVRRTRLTRAAKGSVAEETYGCIRQALDALRRIPTSNMLPIGRRVAVDEVYAHLYRAEDAIEKVLGLDIYDREHGVTHATYPTPR